MYGGKQKTTGWEPSCTCHGEPTPQDYQCPSCRGSGRELTSAERKAGHFPENGRRESDKRGTRANLGETLMVETGDPCPVCGGSGTITRDGFSDEVLAVWPRIPCVVLDPMCGSGPTGRAALSLGRSFEGNDLSAEYVDLARERLEAFPGDVQQVRAKREKKQQEPNSQLNFLEVNDGR